MNFRHLQKKATFVLSGDDFFWEDAVKSLLPIVFCLLICSAAPLVAEEHHHEHSYDDHAHGLHFSHDPIGVMGSHIHSEGEGMLSYRYMFMSMDGNRSGTSFQSVDEVLGDFMVSPVDMDMHMHMVGGMYAVSDNFTIMGMLPLVELSMNHRTRMGGAFKTRASGIGDIKLSPIFSLATSDNSHLLLSTGVNLPTGDIDERDDTPAMANARLPYPMQIGSGTFDLLPGVTYTYQKDQFFWGSQVRGTLRLGENSKDYTLGDRYEASAWGGALLNDSVSVSTRLLWSQWGNVDGADEALNPMMVPTADTNLRAGRRLDIGAGLSVYLPKVIFHSQRLALEALVPVYQNVDGPQLETDMTLIFGWQGTF